MPRKHNRLMGDSLHQIAVRNQRVCAVIHDVITESGVQDALAQSHSDGVGKPLTERSGGGFNAGRQPPFRMPCGFRIQLSKLFNLADRHVLIAAQMQQPVQQHRSVSRRQNKTVTIGPTGRSRVKLQKSRKQNTRHIRHPHRHARMSACGALDRVNGKNT